MTGPIGTPPIVDDLSSTIGGGRSRRRARAVPGRPPTKRQLAEQRERRRALVIASASTVVVFSVLVFLVTHSAGWPDVKRSFFDGHVYRTSLGEVFSAFGLNVKIFLWAEVFILVLSLLIALARSSRSPVLFPVRLLTGIYVDVFRGIPALLVILLLGFGMPALQLAGVPSDPVFWAIVALILSYSAYVSEVFRSGIDSVHESQRASARSLGLSTFQTMRFVILPQGIRRVIPPLLNDFIALQKETALVSVIGPVEAARQAQIISSKNFNFTPYLAAATIFLIITIPLTRLTDWLIKRQRVRTGARGRA